MKHFTLVLFLLIALPCQPADLIFGRRVYSAQGRTYQQVWAMDTRTKQMKPLTSAERRHSEPACSPGAKRIWFASGAFGDDKNTELWYVDHATGTEKLATEVPHGIGRLLGGTDTAAYFEEFDSGSRVLYRWDGKLTKMRSLPEAGPGAALAPDALSLAIPSGGDGSIIIDGVTTAPGHALENCLAPAWSDDGRKIACVDAGRNIQVMNLTTGIQAAHFAFNERTTNPVVVDYSRDGKRLLVGTIGANSNSSSPQNDYWVFEMTTRKWTFVGPGQSALFTPEDGVVLVTPRELSKIGKGHDWVSQMLIVDPVTHAQTPLTSGNSSNVEPRRCTVTLRETKAIPPAALKPLSLQQQRH